MLILLHECLVAPVVTSPSMPLLQGSPGALARNGYIREKPFVIPQTRLSCPRALPSRIVG